MGGEFPDTSLPELRSVTTVSLGYLGMLAFFWVLS